MIINFEIKYQIQHDLNTLNAQINAKKQRDAEEKELDKKFVNEALRRDALLIEKEKKEMEERRKKQRDIIEFNKNYVKKELSREFDINDPKIQKNSLPPRTSDHDIRLSISGAQKFLGEDLRDAERKKAQIEQQKAWLDKQISDKKRFDLDNKKADEIINESLKAFDLRQVQLEQERMNVQRKRAEAVARFNTKLKTDNEINKLQYEKEQEEDDLAEIYNVLTSDMMTENKDCGSIFGSKRKQTSKYRGMTDDEIREIREEQTRQRNEMEKSRNFKKMENEKWNSIANNLDKKTVTESMKEERNELQKRIDIRDYNKMLATEQKTRNKFIDKVASKNEIKPEFFMNFNTTTR